MPDLARRIEEASLNGWPARHQMLYDGWIARSNQGYTRRANSVTPLYPSRLDLEQKIATCEAWYTAQSLPPVFRLTTLIDNTALDAALAARGYEARSRTLVLHLDLQDRQIHPALLTRRLQDESPPLWMDAFCRVSGADRAQHDPHLDILERIATPRILAVLVPAGQVVVACGVAVLDGKLVGILDLVTDSQQRNQGYGTQMLANLLKWGQDHGACSAYLSVEAENAAARHVYERKFGFRQVYEYVYRQRPES